MLQKARGSYVSAEEFNALVDVVNQLARLNVGPGLELRQGAGGTVIALASPAYGDVDATFKTLVSTMGVQDSDTWDVEIDGRGTGKGVELSVFTDLQYSNVTHKFSSRLRTLQADKHGRIVGITGEGALSDIVTAVAGCT